MWVLLVVLDGIRTCWYMLAFYSAGELGGRGCIEYNWGGGESDGTCAVWN